MAKDAKSKRHLEGSCSNLLFPYASLFGCQKRLLMPLVAAKTQGVELGSSSDEKCQATLPADIMGPWAHGPMTGRIHLCVLSSWRWRIKASPQLPMLCHALPCCAMLCHAVPVQSLPPKQLRSPYKFAHAVSTYSPCVNQVQAPENAAMLGTIHCSLYAHRFSV